MRLITHKKHEAEFAQLAPKLQDRSDALSGGLSEWSQSPFHQGFDGCVYYLCWSANRRAVGLLVEVIEGSPPRRKKDHSALYLWLIDNGQRKEQMVVIAQLEESESKDENKLLTELEEAHAKAGGTIITEPIF